ncbi:D-2-hydroxyacid dehydrogenase [Sansalvadorimonas verongulae]|uniref:D-2-hydroxyacid dehydrogenase n=1 Tax=Sansalvadorimonas verongulae TaxID=2172824 RepID=UPI0012BB5FDB|nr:D-2-hydroxyacid dehydrogenase [Sansalvadorimonas verongulae]MTI13494.1 D-2-hydroxyacid dehydrogenase [Sansalvadorimonas verongulae]
MRAVILDRATLGDDLEITPFLNINLDWVVHDTTQLEQTLERIAGADIVLTNKVVIDRALMEQAPSLKYIGVLATGTNNVDITAAKEHGITVTNVTAYGTASVAQHALAMMLSLATALPHYHQLSTDGSWAKSDMFCVMDKPIMELSGKNILIIGYGELGRSVARLAKAFGMNLLIAQVPGSTSSHEGKVSLEEGLKAADVVSLHCPLTERTRNMIGKEQLALMKPHALLINTARGGLVDEQALVAALKAGGIGGAGFDVLTEEPPVNGNPLLEPSIPNLIVTPHTAWMAKESRGRVIDLAAGNLLRFMADA